MTTTINQISDVLTAKAAGEYLDYHPDYLRCLIRAGKINAYRMGKRMFVIPRAELDRYRREVGR